MYRGRTLSSRNGRLLWIAALFLSGYVRAASPGAEAAEEESPPPGQVQTGSVKPQAPTAQISRTLDVYIRHALEHSAELKSAFSSYRATLEKSPQVTALPDPRIRYGLFHRFGIAQAFPWFGTLSLQGNVADAEAKAEAFGFLALKNELAFQVCKTYTELVYLSSALQITGENIELLKSWEQVLQKRFRAGIGSYSDLVRIQVELGKLEDRLAEFRDLIHPYEIAFNSLLNRDGRAPISIDENILSDPSIKGAASSVRQITAEFLPRLNPELSMLDALVEARKLDVKLAKKQYFPELMLELELDGSADSRKDAIMPMLSLNLPLRRGKYAAGVREARFQEESVAAMKQSKEYMLQAELAMAQFDLRDSERRIGLFEHTLIPKVQESLDASFAAYKSGKVGFLSLLDAERELLDLSLDLSRARADRFIATTQIYMLTGGYSELPSFDQEMQDGNSRP